MQPKRAPSGASRHLVAMAADGHSDDPKRGRKKVGELPISHGSRSGMVTIMVPDLHVVRSLVLAASPEMLP